MTVMTDSLLHRVMKVVVVAVAVIVKTMMKMTMTMGCYHPHVFRVDEDCSAEDVKIQIATMKVMCILDL